MMKSQEKQTRPAWIAGLVEHLEAAFKDKRLPVDVRDALTTAVSDIENRYSADVVVSREPSLSIALERAIKGMEDADSEHDDSDSDDDLSDEDNEFTTAIATIITDPRTPEYIASPLMTIMNNILNGEDGAVSRKFAKIGDCVAAVIESKDVPDEIKRPLENAAIEIMNELNQDGEMEAAWFRCFFEQAVRRESAKG